MTDKPDGKRWARGFLPILIGILLFYVLSVGPAGWLCEKVDPNANGIPGRIFLAAYSPLGFVAERTDSQELFLRYCSLFVELKGL